MPAQPPPPPRRFARGDAVLATVPAVVSAVFPASPQWLGPAYRVQVESATTGAFVEIDVADESRLAPAPATPGGAP